MLKKRILFLTILFIFTVTVAVNAVTNTWDGSFNSYWHNTANWSQGHIPTSAEDVVIPSGLSRYPTIDFYDEECNSLTIENGANITIVDQKLTVSGDVSVSGSINLNDTASKLFCNNITWNSGSTATTTGSATIYLTGIWEFAEGSSVHLDHGYVQFYSTGHSYIRSNSSDSYFYTILGNKNNDYLAISSLSQEPVRITGALYIYSACTFRTFSSQPINIEAYIYNSSGTMQLDYGTITLSGNYHNYFEAGDYFNNLTIQANGTVYFEDPIEIKGNLVIESGTLDPNDNTITVGGNWTNNVGDAAFIEGSGRVIFNGSSHQYCSDEYFNILEINKPSAAFRLNGTTVTCESYDWTSGSIDVLSGTFTANDLVDDGIFGNWYLNDGGVINVYQDNSQYVDLNGNLHIFGGTFNVNGGNGDSYWSYASDASLEMSGGTLDFKDNGIYIYSSGTYNLTTDITGGTIRTPDNLRVNNSNFTPTGGLIELYGSADTYITHSAGTIYAITINKQASRNIPKNDFYYDRNGHRHYRTRNLTVSLNSDVTLSNDLIINSGTLDIQDHTLSAYNLTVYGQINMTDAAAAINVSRIFSWEYGSSSNITAGNIDVHYFYVFKNGTNASLGNSTTLTMSGTSSGVTFLANRDSDATIGNLNLTADDIYFNTSYDTLRVTGNIDVAAGSFVHLDDYNLIADGTLSIPNTSSFSVSTGTLINNSDMPLSGTLSLTGNGTIQINGAFDLNATGNLEISDGNFYETGSYICDMDGTLTMSGGTLNIPESLFIGTNPVNISGGSIYARILTATNPNTFQPSDGYVILTTNGTGSLNLHSTNYFRNLEINTSSSVYGIQLFSDIEVRNKITITQGFLELSGYSLNSYDMDIYGNLIMDNSSDSLVVDNQLTFKDGSTSDITEGNITCRIIKAESSSNASISGNNILTITGDSSGGWGYLIVRPQSFTLQNLIIDHPNPTELLGITDTLIVLGDLTLNPNRELKIDTYRMKVNGTISTNATSTINVTSGSLICESPFNLSGTLNLTTGNINIKDSFDIASTGVLNITDNGTFSEMGSYIMQIYGTLNMSQGEIITSESMRFENGSSSNITGGEITTKVIWANYAGSLAPTGGKFILNPNGTGSISVTNGNYLHNLEISSPGHGSQLIGDLTVNNYVTITDGFLNLNGHSLTTYGMEIYGQLIMANSSDNLTVNNQLIFKNGSTSNITEGNIVCRIIDAEPSSNASFSGNNVLTITGASTGGWGYLIVRPQSFTLQNLIIDHPNPTELLGITDTLIVLGNLTINPNRTLQIESYNMKVNGTITTDATSTITLTSGSLTNNSDFALNGSLTIGSSGFVTVNSAFDISSSGNLVINSGNLIENGNHICSINGTLNMSGGLFRAFESFIIYHSANVTVSDGIISCEAFIANTDNTFQPTGGTLEMITSSGVASLSLAPTNYLHNLDINATTTVRLSSDITIHNNLHILNGQLDMYDKTATVQNNAIIDGELKMINAGGTLNISGDMTWSSTSLASISNGAINLYGDLTVSNSADVNLSGSNVVTFLGNANSDINIYSNDFNFSDLTISKNSANMVTYNSDGSSQDLNIGGDLTINSGTFYIEHGRVKAWENTHVNGGEFRMNDSTEYKVGNEFIINNTGTFNAVVSSGNDALVSALSSPYEFSIESGGTISAENVIFEGMDTNGLNIKAGAAVDASYPLNYCTFKNSADVLLTINNDQTLTINNATFIAGASKDATVNVRKTVNTGNVTFSNATGSFAGPDYEDDNYNRINWSGFGPDLRIANVTYTNTNPYLAEDVIATVTIQNAGNAAFDGSTSFYVDFFNNPSSSPAIGDYGDEYIEIQNTAIAKNDTIQRNIHISSDVAQTWNSYLIVDTDDIITEIDETNNIYGPDTITWNALPSVSNLQISLSSGTTTLTWQYPISADSYKIYKTTDPYDYSGATIMTSNIKRYSETTSGEKYFYTVTAVRNYPPAKAKTYILTHNIKQRRKNSKLNKR